MFCVPALTSQLWPLFTAATTPWANCDFIIIWCQRQAWWENGNNSTTNMNNEWTHIISQNRRAVQHMEISVHIIFPWVLLMNKRAKFETTLAAILLYPAWFWPAACYGSSVHCTITDGVAQREPTIDRQVCPEVNHVYTALGPLWCGCFSVHQSRVARPPSHWVCSVSVYWAEHHENIHS